MTTPEEMKGRDEVLAGEYVLGVLSVNDRRKVEARMVLDRTFAATVRRWQDNLESFNEAYDEVPVPARVQPRVEARLFGEPMARPTLWSSLAFWRGLTASALAAAGVFAGAYFGVIAPRPAGQPLVAELKGDNNAVSLMAHYDAGSGRLQFTPVATGAEEKSLELWLIKGDNPALSLGVLPQSGEGELIVPAKYQALVEDGVTLAISLEQYGGSPTGTAQGPIIAVGAAKKQ